MKDDFENKTFQGVHYSRFIASWTKAIIRNPPSGIDKYDTPARFEAWLSTLSVCGRRIPYSVRKEILFLYENGKLELEESAKEFLNGYY